MRENVRDLLDLCVVHGSAGPCAGAVAGGGGRAASAAAAGAAAAAARACAPYPADDEKTDEEEDEELRDVEGRFVVGWAGGLRHG